MARLQAYQARLLLFPRKPGQHKPGDASQSDIETFTKSQEDGDSSKAVRSLGTVLPIVDEGKLHPVTEVKTKDMPKGEAAAYRKLRTARSDARLVGVREKRAKAKAEEAAADKKSGGERFGTQTSLSQGSVHPCGDNDLALCSASRELVASLLPFCRVSYACQYFCVS